MECLVTGGRSDTVKSAGGVFLALMYASTEEIGVEQYAD